jgi:membrane-bound lytic murein transglycosylase B
LPRPRQPRSKRGRRKPGIAARSATGFAQWLNGFKHVAVLDGVSPEVVDAALSGVSYDAAVKAHDGGVAAFGHHFARFAASHITPGESRGAGLCSSPTARRGQRWKGDLACPDRCWWPSWDLKRVFGLDNGSYCSP